MQTITSPSEAFFVASEMERRAVRLYERALLIFTNSDAKGAILNILAQEREHLTRFLSFQDSADAYRNNAALLSAQAAQIIFSGGLMEAHRMGAFSSPERLFEYAMTQEKGAIAAYTRFAALMPEGDERAKAFLSIADEENNHLGALESQLKAVQAQKE